MKVPTAVAEQHIDCVAVSVHRHEVVEGVAVEVGRHRREMIAVVERRDVRRRKTAVAVAQQHVGVARAAVAVQVRVGVRRHAEIEQPVAVEVAHGHGLRVLTIAKADAAGRLEGAVAVAQEDAHIVGIGGRQVDGCRPHRSRRPRARAGQRQWRSCGPAETSRSRCQAARLPCWLAVAGIADREVQHVVVVEVGRHHRLALHPRRSGSSRRRGNSWPG